MPELVLSPFGARIPSDWKELERRLSVWEREARETLMADDRWASNEEIDADLDSMGWDDPEVMETEPHNYCAFELLFFVRWTRWEIEKLSEGVAG